VVATLDRAEDASQSPQGTALAGALEAVQGI
jgi:hypothetical protein